MTMSFTLPPRAEREAPWIESAVLRRDVYLTEVDDLDDADLVMLSAECANITADTYRLIKTGEADREVEETNSLWRLFQAAIRATQHRRRISQTWEQRQASDNRSARELQIQLERTTLELQQARESRDRWKLRANGLSGNLTSDDETIAQVQLILQRDPDAVEARASLRSAASALGASVGARAAVRFEHAFVGAAQSALSAEQFSEIAALAALASQSDLDQKSERLREALDEVDNLLRALCVGTASLEDSVN